VAYRVSPIVEIGGISGSLAGIVRFEVGGEFPEDVDIDDAGWLTTGVLDGRVLRISPDGSQVVTLADTGGRPLGLHRAGDGSLLVADTERGLLRITTDGVITELLPSGAVNGPRFADDVESGPDGKIYLSDASTRFPFQEWKRDLMAGTCTGRLIRIDPEQGPEDGPEVLLHGLCFANGVAVHSGGAFVLVSETGRYRVRRYWLRGPRAGRDEVFLDALPGFPDGISSTPRGTFWIAIASPRNAILNGTAGLPGLRVLMDLLPASLQPKLQRHPRVIEVDAGGRVLRDLQDPLGTSFGVITSVQEANGQLWFGSLTETALGHLPR
jgi:sugar lactone lactonase YvrE